MEWVSGVSEEFKTRIRFPMSDREMKRRWMQLQTAMEHQGIDVLIAQNADQYLGGYFRYITDLPTEQAYPMSVLFPAKGEMTTITSSSPYDPLPPAWFGRGIKTRLGAPYFRTFRYTDLYDAKLMEAYICDHNCRTVGLIAPSLLNYQLVNYLKTSLPKVSFVDVTEMVDEIKAVKSEDEIQAIRRTVKLHDQILQMVPGMLRPGMYEYELRAEVNKFLISKGSEENLVMMGSAPSGTPTPKLHSFYQNRRIEDGDDLVFMIEANGPGGYYAEIVRGFCIGHQPSKELCRAWELSKEMQDFTAQLVKPGADCGEILELYNKKLVSYGLRPETRLFAHGQGYDLVERPAFFKGETMKVKENMFFSIHPEVNTGKAFGNYCDQYLVTSNGAVRMETTPREIFVV
ncbi:Creatinase [uncultured Roseburia sp.]|uniref:M24 family metallopeptidase n=1 Tax=Brotonthovivens ammoniilytica TaxID=2981725 RepID=A0ABT2TLV5_9FIRM|nr:M24 family metallopeptidase [Brotonthovivens ammoniilytica]MCU6763195.1 M24 family metallopeptidase [Brotonthovivens ammoniilytica]SCJ06369.1 Creatinase [uncultured Roseburia sp.]